MLLLLGLLIAQASASPPGLAAPPTFSVRRMPDTAPRVVPSGSAIIRNSGSTNVPGYTIVLHPSGTAEFEHEGTSVPAPVGQPQVKWLFAKLRAASLEDFGGHGCMKSASFGTTTTIEYDGKTTKDLSCGADAQTREINRTASVIAMQAGAGNLRPGHRLPQ